jgi:hypothetical protein
MFNDDIYITGTLLIGFLLHDVHFYFIIFDQMEEKNRKIRKSRFLSYLLSRIKE